MSASCSGRKWASRTTYPDGSTHEYITIGSAIYPSSFYERGTSLNARPGCIGPNNEDFVLSIDESNSGPYNLDLLPELATDERPFVQLFNDVGKQVSGAHVDDLGRPSQLWELRTEGSAGYGNLANNPTVQIQDWWVNPSDGTTITQRRFINTVDQLGTATVTETLTTDETITVPASTFDPARYRSLPTFPRPEIKPIDNPPLGTSPRTGP